MTDEASSPPRVLQWYSGGLGVVWDEGLNLHSRAELMRWLQDGHQFVILDYETGSDVTQLFIADWDDGATHPIDPAK
jgi:hypothetical protein